MFWIGIQARAWRAVVIIPKLNVPATDCSKGLKGFIDDQVA
jgi:hypothetical protein